MDKPLVGVAVIIKPEGQSVLLLGLRKGSHQAGKWACPGGHLEVNEDPIEAAKREVLEETGLELYNIKTLGYSSNIFKDCGKHYITLFVAGIIRVSDISTVVIKEPDKCVSWIWVNSQWLYDNEKDLMEGSLEHLLRALK